MSSRVTPPAHRRSSARSPRNSQRKPRENLTLDEWKQLALDGQDVSTIDSPTLRKLTEVLKEYRNQLVAEGEESEVADTAFLRVKALNDERMKTDAARDHQAKISERLEKAREDLQNLEDTIHIQERNMKAEMATQISEMQEKHRKELETLADTFDSPQRLRRYNRVSQTLRTMRIQQIKLLNSHRYDEMSAVRKQADALQEEEAVLNEERLERDFEEALVAVKRRQEVDMAKLLQAQAVQVDRYNAAKNFDLRVARQRLKKLELEMDTANDPEKVWLRYYRTESQRLGKRARARSCRGIAKRSIQTQEFNTLNLPALAEPNSARIRRPDFSKTDKFTQKRQRVFWL